MEDLSVAECLREADQQVRDLTFDLGDLDSERLLAGWPDFFDASRRVLDALTWPGAEPDTAEVAALQAHGWRTSWRPPAGIEGEPRLVAATVLLSRAADLIEQHGSPGAPDRLQVSNHVMATVCVGAHVVSRGAHEYLGATQGAERTSGINDRDVVFSRLPRHVYREQAVQVDRVEDLAGIALRQAGHHTPPAGEDPGSAGVQDALNQWVEATSTLLQSGQPSVDDMRLVAQATAQLEMHSTVLAAAAHHTGVLDDDQMRALVPALQTAGQQWAAAAQDWPRHMAALQRTSSRQVRDAALSLNQTLAAVTHPNPARWATSQEIASTHDVERTLERVASAHRRVEHLAEDYERAGTALVNSGQVTVHGRAAFEFTGKVSAAGRVTVPPEHVDRMSYSHATLAGAARGVRSALDTATVLTPEATRARARVPLSMASQDIEQSVRARVDDARSSPAVRLEQLREKLRESQASTKPARDDTHRHPPTQTGPRLS